MRVIAREQDGGGYIVLTDAKRERGRIVREIDGEWVAFPAMWIPALAKFGV